jgi:hypothetical protein
MDMGKRNDWTDRGMGNREPGTGSRERGTGNREREGPEYRGNGIPKHRKGAMQGDAGSHQARMANMRKFD